MARQDANQNFLNTAFLYGANASYIEDLQARYEKDPASVDAEWQAFFGALKDDKQAVEKAANGPSWEKPHWPIHANGELVSALDGNWAQVEKAVGDKIKAKAEAKGMEISQIDVQQATRDSIRAIMLIRAYRVRGHLHAKLDPLGINPRPSDEELHPSHYGFTEADWDRKVFLDNVLGLEFGTIREIVALLERTYCQTLGVEFMHISDPAEKAWIQERIEGLDKEITFTREGKRAILNKLVEAEGFERFLDLKYTGTKRFGLDGSESLIPALEQIIKRGGNLGVKEIVLGMAHRGRLNVLTQVMAKPHRALFHEFKGGSFAPDDVEGSGDVKYHLGASSDRIFDGNNVHLSLTANPRFSRSSPYPSDVAKMVEAPIFHVNGDDPEAVFFAAKVATDYRQRFHKPVVVDMFCYRRFGHNEGDEPAFTQPKMYRKIRSHPTTLELYAQKLEAEGVVTPAEVDEMKGAWRAKLEQE